MKPVFFKSAADFRQWLDQHHASERELLVGLYRKELKRGLTYSEALDGALSFGWIDGARKRIDAAAYSIRFIPRKRGSIWSVVNTQRVRQLTAQGLMKPPGLLAFRESEEQKTRQYSYERERQSLTRYWMQPWAPARRLPCSSTHSPPAIGERPSSGS